MAKEESFSQRIDEFCKPVDMGGVATDVVRRQTDGNWRYVIDNRGGWLESEVFDGGTPRALL